MVENFVLIFMQYLSNFNLYLFSFGNVIVLKLFTDADQWALKNVKKRKCTFYKICYGYDDCI